MSRAPAGVAVQFDERGKALRLAADDRQREGKPECPGANDRLRRPPNRDPDRQGVLHWPRVDAEVFQRSTMLSRPGDTLLLAKLQQQLQLFGEEVVIVAQVVPEERKGLDERAAPGHDLRAAVRERSEERRVGKECGSRWATKGCYE